jgi:hypothetical protein
MGSAANLEPERWEEVLDHLSSMISGKRRADGATWRDAHENMPIYLQVLAAPTLQHCRLAWLCLVIRTPVEAAVVFC